MHVLICLYLMLCVEIVALGNFQDAKGSLISIKSTDADKRPSKWTSLEQYIKSQRNAANANPGKLLPAVDKVAYSSLRGAAPSNPGNHAQQITYTRLPQSSIDYFTSRPPTSSALFNAASPPGSRASTQSTFEDFLQNYQDHGTYVSRHKRQFDSYDKFDLNTTFKYEYMFGFSTGHCGTTSLAQRPLFGNGTRQQKIHFEHEMQGTRLSAKDYRHYSEKDEYEYVSRLLFRRIDQAMANNTAETVFYDNGHHSLYFINGLIKFLTQMSEKYPNQLKYTILRVRRNRYETALSLTFQGDHAANPELLRSRYHPFERTHDMIYRIYHAEWANFTHFQKALWMVDETEARWQRYLKTYPTLKYVDVYWESTPGLSTYTYDNAVRVVARALGVNESDITFNVTYQHEHVTPEVRAQLRELRSQLHEQDLHYLDVMRRRGHDINFSHLPPTYNSYEIPPLSQTV